MPAAHSEPHTIKVVVLGYYSVGKSSLVSRYIKGHFSTNQESTIGAAFFTKTIFHQNIETKFEIWDTAGQERYNSLIPMYYRGASCALIVYDVTSKESLETAKRWIAELKIEKPNNFLKILIGNKTDLAERQVSFEDAMVYAEQNELLFYETSAKTENKIAKIFDDIAEIVPKSRKVKVEAVNTTEKKNFSCC